MSTVLGPWRVSSDSASEGSLSLSMLGSMVAMFGVGRWVITGPAPVSIAIFAWDNSCSGGLAQDGSGYDGRASNIDDGV